MERVDVEGGRGKVLDEGRRYASEWKKLREALRGVGEDDRGSQKMRKKGELHPRSFKMLKGSKVM